MRGFPKVIGCKQDVYNLETMASRGEIDKADLTAYLDNLLATRQHYVLKEDAADTPAEEQTPDDYELVDDPNAQMVRLGITEEEIDEIKGGL